MTTTERWQLHGNAAELYERYLVPTLFMPWAHDLIHHAGLQPGERVIDVACGTGSVTRLLSAQVGGSGHIIAIDLNAQMLAAARGHVIGQTTPLTWLQADVADLPLPTDGADVVLCQQSFQFFPAKLRALKEMRRVLAPGGRLVLNVSRGLAFNPYIRALADGLEQHIDQAAGESMRAPCSFGAAESLRNLFTQAGFHRTSIRISCLLIRHPDPADFIRGQLAATPVADQVAALDDQARKSLVADILAQLQGYMDDDGLAAPYEIHVCTAYA